MTASSCFLFLRDAMRRGEKCALATITGIVGSASRSLGTHLAVSDAGQYCGSLSGGCIEAAVAAEARRIIARGRAEIVRFGSGSPFIDIRLPCGGGIDLLITPDPAAAAIEAACDHFAARKPFTLRLDEAAAATIDDEDAATGWRGEQFSVRHHPGLKLVVAGQGEEALTAVALAKAYGADTSLLTHERGLTEPVGVRVRHLTNPDAPAELMLDAYSAILLLFHEHEWETELLIAALRQPAFFIGAMGSPATHRTRIGLLRERGVPETGLARITGPVGLIPATREPATLALSALAQIVAGYRLLVEDTR